MALTASDAMSPKRSVTFNVRLGRASACPAIDPFGKGAGPFAGQDGEHSRPSLSLRFLEAETRTQSR